MHFSIFVSNGNEFHILGPAAEKDDLCVCVFYRSLSLDTQSWMISMAFHDVRMVIVPESILVLDCSYIYVWEKLFYMLSSLLSSACVMTLGDA